MRSGLRASVEKLILVLVLFLRVHYPSKLNVTFSCVHVKMCSEHEKLKNIHMIC